MADITRQKKILEELVKARKAVKRKYDLIKHQKDNSEHIFNETFKPIINPLEKLVEQKDTGSVKNDEHFKEFDPGQLFVKKSDENEINGSFNESFFMNPDYPNVFEPATTSNNQHLIDFTDERDNINEDESESKNVLDTSISNKSFDNIKIGTSELDKCYGIQKKKNGYTLGSVPIRFEKDKIIANDKPLP